MTFGFTSQADSLTAADHFIDELVAKIQILATQPAMGRSRKERLPIHFGVFPLATTSSSIVHCQTVSKLSAC